MTVRGIELNVLFISYEQMEARYAAAGGFKSDLGVEPWVLVARILNERLTIDLTNPANADVKILINGEDFSFLAPHPKSGTFTPILSLLDIYENKLVGFEELSPEVRNRYELLIETIKQLMYSLISDEQERLAKAA